MLSSSSPRVEPSSFGSQWPEKGGMLIRSMSRLFNVSDGRGPEPRAWEGPRDWLTSTGESGLGQPRVTEDTHTHRLQPGYATLGKRGEVNYSCDGVSYKGKWRLNSLIELKKGSDEEHKSINAYSEENVRALMFVPSNWSNVRSQFSHLVEKNASISVECLFKQRNTVHKVTWTAAQSTLYELDALVFPCSGETHSSVAPLTLERGKRSCRNKWINKQHGESPGFSPEVVFSLSLFSVCDMLWNWIMNLLPPILFYKDIEICLVTVNKYQNWEDSASKCLKVNFHPFICVQFVTCFSRSRSWHFGLVLFLCHLPAMARTYGFTSCLAGCRAVVGS